MSLRSVSRGRAANCRRCSPRCKKFFRMSTIVPLGLDHHPFHIRGPAGRGNNIKRPIPHRFQIFIPIGVLRRHHHPNFVRAAPHSLEEVTEGPVGQVAVAKDQPNVFLCQSFLAFSEGGYADRIQSLSSKRLHQGAAALQVRRSDQNLPWDVHLSSPLPSKMPLVLAYGLPSGSKADPVSDQHLLLSL